MATPCNLDILTARKADLRQLALRSRLQQHDRETTSDTLCQKSLDLAEYQLADTVCSYVGVGAEVLTQNLIIDGLSQGKRIIVPYVDKDHLHLFHLHRLDELTPAPFGLLEPRSDLRSRREAQIDPSNIDLYLIPGLAFGVSGERLGHGKGYYDNLLHRASDQSKKVGLCFACQIMDDIPMLGHDVYMDLIITEQGICHSR